MVMVSFSVFAYRTFKVQLEDSQGEYSDNLYLRSFPTEP